MIQLITPVQLTDTEPETQTGSDQATLSRLAGQTELELDIMKADGSYFIPVDSGSIETKTMTIVSSSDGTVSGSDDGAAGEAFTEVAFSRDSKGNQGTEEDGPDIYGAQATMDGSERRLEQPQLDHLVQMLEQEANGESSADRKLAASQEQGDASKSRCICRPQCRRRWVYPPLG